MNLSTICVALVTAFVWFLHTQNRKEKKRFIFYKYCPFMFAFLGQFMELCVLFV